MADTPIFPDGENIAQAKDYLSIQQQLVDIMRKQKGIYDDIGKINKDVEAKVRIRYQREEDLLKQIRTQKALYYKEESEGTAKMNDAERAKHKANLHSMRVEIKSLQERFAASRAISDMEIDMAKKQHAEDTKWYNFSSDKLKEITGLEFKHFSAVKSTGDQLLKLGVNSQVMAYTFGAIFMMLKGAFDLFKKMDTAAWEFRKAMGMTRMESQFIRKDAEKLAIDYMSMGVTIDGVYKSYQAIGKAVGGVHNVTKDMARDVALMSSQLGISEETSANFMQNLAAISKSSMESQTNMMGLAQAMSSAAGVNLGEVMSDVAKASGPTLTMMSRLPNLALRSAIELRRMGTSLSEAAKSSKHILDFQTSMDEEMNASVLLGRSINLQRARELAYRRDLEGSTKEILRITKSVDFANLDVFQQQAFADATGKSVDELMKMLQTDKQIAQIKRGGTDQQKAELANYEKMRQENEKAAKARANDAMVQIRTMANQERMTQLSSKWNQILAKAQAFLLPILDNVLGIALGLMDVAPLLMSLISPISSVAKWVGKAVMFGDKMTISLMNIARYGISTASSAEKFFAWIAKGGKVVKWIGTAFNMIGKSFGFFGKFLGVFSKFLGPIGWVIMAFQLIANLVGRVTDYFKNWANMSIGQRIVQGLLIIPKAVWEVVVQPFVDAFKYIWSFFGGHSPSKLGMGIVNGIVSIGSMLFNAITAPYRMAFHWIINKFSGIGKFLGKLFGSGSVEKKAAAAYIPAVTVTPNGTKIETPTAKAETAAAKKDTDIFRGMTEETGQKMVVLLEKILAKDNSIRMDGQLLSSTLARQTEFKGGYGVNKV